jgi:hypothetical protein
MKFLRDMSEAFLKLRRTCSLSAKSVELLYEYHSSDMCGLEFGITFSTWK